MARIPREARDGLMRAWLEILRERHPEVTWVTATEMGPHEEHLRADERTSQEEAEQLAA